VHSLPSRRTPIQVGGELSTSYPRISQATTPPLSDWQRLAQSGWPVGQTTRVPQVEAKSFRTARDPSVPAQEALRLLKEGNARYTSGQSTRAACAEQLTALAEHGQNPMAVVLGCADSRCPVETMLDAGPGDIFVLRNAGNTCPSGEDSIVGSVEFATGALGTKLLVVMGHTKCGAIKGATQLAVAAPSRENKACACALDRHLEALVPAAKEAATELGAGASVEAVAAAATRANVLITIRALLENSDKVRDLARSGGLELHGAVYHIESGRVEFIGQHPRIAKLLEVAPPAVPSPLLGA